MDVKMKKLFFCRWIWPVMVLLSVLGCQQSGSTTASLQEEAPMSVTAHPSQPADVAKSYSAPPKDDNAGTNNDAPVADVLPSPSPMPVKDTPSPGVPANPSGTALPDLPPAGPSPVPKPAAEASSPTEGEKEQKAPIDQAVPPSNPPSKKTASTETESGETGKIYISIHGDENSGLILSETPVEFMEGDTVLKALQRIAEKEGISLEIRGRGAFTYIEGIADLYEFDHGPKSGWMFRVNSKFAGRSAGSVKLNEGDKVEWLYTTDLGRDLEGQ